MDDILPLCADLPVRLFAPGETLMTEGSRSGIIFVLEEGAVGSGGGGADPMAYSHEPHCRLIADFLDALDEGRDPRSSGRTALHVHRLIDAMLASNGNAVAVAQ